MGGNLLHANLTGTHRVSRPCGTADLASNVISTSLLCNARLRNSWAEIDVPLTCRHDLIPNLVESVRGYMQHESSTLKPVTQARAQTMAIGGNVQQRAVAESTLTQAVGKLLAIAENYPQLRHRGRSATAGTIRLNRKPQRLCAAVLQR
jgi:hypothetical protein